MKLLTEHALIGRMENGKKMLLKKATKHTEGKTRNPGKGGSRA